MKIKPCPVCGCEPKIKKGGAHLVDNLWMPYWTVECDSNDPVIHRVSVSGAAGETKEEAVEKWNAACKGGGNGD